MMLLLSLPGTATDARTTLWRPLLAMAVAVLIPSGTLPSVLAQQRSPTPSEVLIQRYQAARQRVLVQRIVQTGHRGVRPLPPTTLPVASDSLLRLRSPDAASSSAGPALAVTSVRKVRKLERSWFRDTFHDTPWAFFGSSRRFAFVDTTRTRDLRARLETQYGPPTQALGDFDLRSPRDEYIQFEYWFVVNDTIPVVVIDVGGPMERGLIVSTDAAYRSHLPALRRHLLHPLRDTERSVYVDYYYNDVQRRWYRTGFNGRTFFRERVYRSQLVPGRRPWIDPDPDASRPPRSP